MGTDEKIMELLAAKVIEDLPGEGQAICDNCGGWSWFYLLYKGKVYCYRCLYEVIKNEYNL